MPQSKKPRQKQRAKHQHEWQRLANRRDPATREPLYGCISCSDTTTEPSPRFGRINVPVPESVAAMLNSQPIR